MAAMLHFGLRDLTHQWKLGLAMSLAVAISVMVYLTNIGYSASLSEQFKLLAPQYLTVQEANSLGEIYGSRLSPEIREFLLGAGASLIVPEIHDVVGTSMQNATLLRGVDLSQYRQVDAFEMVNGQALGPGEPERLAMVGQRLAQTLSIQPEDTIRLRGRNFKVMGVFKTDTYADNEAWISLEDAQNLLGWNQDVSIYIILDEGIFHEGDNLPGGVAIARRGEGAKSVSEQYQPILSVLQVIAQAMGIAAILALGNILWRLAWLRRRELAILRSVGFSRRSVAGYLFIQSALITTVGLLCGTAGTLCLSVLVKTRSFGFEIQPYFTTQTLGATFLWTAAITLLGTILPVWRFSQLNLAGLLHSES